MKSKRAGWPIALAVVSGGLAVGSGAYHVAARPAQADAMPAVPKALPLSGPVTLVAADVSLATTWEALGLSVERLAEDSAAAIAVLAELKQRIDQPFLNAYLDLEARQIRAAAPGRGLDLAGGLAALQIAAATRQTRVDLPVVALPARVTQAELGISDIGHVLGTFTTKFSVADKERNFNLKLAASKLNGHVLAPGALLSFNEVVGERSQEAGYKIAHVIEAGEMVDGLAGGTCQISTTLFAASFFAGLSIVSQTPHSRPSVYAEPGLDATVVWPNVDLQLSNPYDFPVVVHYKVARGEATVEILGAKRPWDKIEFARQVIDETPYTQEIRTDPALQIGTSRVDQPGFNGYKVQRVRTFYKDGKPGKSEKSTVTYRPVVEYTRVGLSLDPNAPPAKPLKPHMPQPPGHRRVAIAQ